MKHEARDIKLDRYELVIRKGNIMVLIFGEGLPSQGSANECVQLRTGKSLPGLRKHTAKMAKLNGVPFVDRTS